jgi:hypothetical protein
MASSRNQNRIYLNNSERYLLNHYIDMYNTTNRQIDHLYNNLNDIRENIDIITGMSNRRNNYINRNNYNNRNINRNYYNNNPENNNNIPYIDEVDRNERNIIYSRRNGTINDIFHSIINSISPSSNHSLTTEQINSATRACSFSEIENPINDTCPISFERFLPTDNVRQILQCGHIFYNDEILRWFQNHDQCPVCRYNLSEYNSHASQDQDVESNTSVTDPSQNPIERLLYTLTNDNLLNLFPSTLQSRLVRNQYTYDTSNNTIYFDNYYIN